MFEREKSLQETAHTIRISGQLLHYRVVGAQTQPPLVLVHGYGSSGHIWKYTEPYLAEHYQLFIVDVPGFGRSTPERMWKTRERWRLQGVAPLLVEWLQTLGLQSFALMGHSMGGAIAIHLAAHIPECVERLVLVNAAGLPLEARLPALAVRSMRSFLQTGNGGYPRELVHDMLYPRLRIRWQSAREMVRSDMRQELAILSAQATPTLIIWGIRDVMLPITLGYALRQLLPQAQFATLEACGHRPMLTQPAEFSQMVLDFLATR